MIRKAKGLKYDDPASKETRAQKEAEDSNEQLFQSRIASLSSKEEVWAPAEYPMLYVFGLGRHSGWYGKHLDYTPPAWGGGAAPTPTTRQDHINKRKGHFPKERIKSFNYVSLS